MVQSVWDYLTLRARLGPHELAVHAPRGPVNRRTLVEDIAGLATELLEQGLSGEAMVGLAFESSYLHLLLVLALDRLNLPSTSLPMPLEPTALAVLARQCGITTLITSEPAPPDPPCRWIRMQEQHRPRIGPSDRARLASIAAPPDALLRVIWSSGTTGSPKGTPITRAKQMRRVDVVSELRAHGPRTRQFVAMGLSSPYDYTDGLGVLMAGGAVILPDTISPFDVVKTFGVTAMGLNATMLRQLLDDKADPLRRFGTMRIDVMGSSLPPGLAREACAMLTPNLCSNYGTTEAVVIATGDAGLCIADPCAVGFLVPWIEAEIVDEQDGPLPPGREGVVRVRGRQIADSYYGEPAGSAPNFRDGWFYPGDLGALADGLLRVTGRCSDAVRCGDMTIGPVPIEAALTELPGICEAAVFPYPGDHGPGDEMYAALVPEPGVDLDAMQAAIKARLGNRAPVRLVTLSRLPRTANGKIAKRQLQDLVRAAREPAAP